MESHDRNELLEFQLQESLQRNFDEGNYVSAFKIPTVCIDYKVNMYLSLIKLFTLSLKNDGRILSTKIH